jgi:hypothetical protein
MTAYVSNMLVLLELNRNKIVKLPYYDSSWIFSSTPCIIFTCSVEYLELFSSLSIY